MLQSNEKSGKNQDGSDLLMVLGRFAHAALCVLLSHSERQQERERKREKNWQEFMQKRNRTLFSSGKYDENNNVSFTYRSPRVFADITFFFIDIARYFVKIKSIFPDYLPDFLPREQDTAQFPQPTAALLLNYFIFSGALWTPLTPRFSVGWERLNAVSMPCDWH